MGSLCCRSVNVVNANTTVSHHYEDSDKQFTSWLYQQKDRYGIDKTVCDDLMTCYMHRETILKKSEWQAWFEEQMKEHEEKKVREIHEKYEKEMVGVVNIKEVRHLCSCYEKDLQRVDNQFRFFHQEDQERPDVSLTVNEQNLIGAVVLSPQIRCQQEDVQKEEERFLNWLYQERMEERLSESLYWKYLQQHIEGQRMAGESPQSESKSKSKAERKRFRLDSEEKNVLNDLQDNLEQDILQNEAQLTKDWLKQLLKIYRKEQHMRLIGEEQEETEGASDPDQKFIGDLMDEVDEEDSEDTCYRVYSYLRENCIDETDEEDVEFDIDDVEKFWKFSRATFSQGDMLARIRLLKVLLAKKMQEAKKAKVKEENEKKQEEVSKQDKTYIGQLTKDDLEDREKIAEEVVERLRDIGCEDHGEEETLDEIRAQAEDEIRGHSEDITPELLLGLLEKYRQIQLDIINREMDDTEDAREDKDDMTDAEFVDKIITDDIDPEKLASLLYQRFSQEGETGETDDDKELTERLARDMKGEILELEGDLDKVEVLAVVLKYRCKHKEASEDAKIKTSFKEDKDFIEGMDSEMLEDREDICVRLLEHVRDPEHLLLGDVAEQFAVEEEEDDLTTEDEMHETDDATHVPGVEELKEDPEYAEKLEALNQALQRLLDQQKMSKEELLDVLVEHRKQIALLIENKRESDEKREGKEKGLKELRDRESVTSSEYEVFMEKYKAEHEQLKAIRDNERNQLQKRFEVILAARLHSKADAAGESDTEEEDEEIPGLEQAVDQKKRGEITEEAFLALMREHMMEKLSIQEHRGKEKSRLQEKLKLALVAHHREREDSEGQADTDLDDIHKKYRKKLREVTEADVQVVVRQYRNERECLVQDRAAMKKRLDEKLKDRLQAQQAETSTTKHKPTQEEQKDQVEKALEEHKKVKQEMVQITVDQKEKHHRGAEEKLKEKRREGKLRKRKTTDEIDGELSFLLGSFNTHKMLIEISQKPDKYQRLKKFINEDLAQENAVQKVAEPATDGMTSPGRIPTDPAATEIEMDIA